MIHYARLRPIDKVIQLPNKFITGTGEDIFWNDNEAKTALMLLRMKADSTREAYGHFTGHFYKTEVLREGAEDFAVIVEKSALFTGQHRDLERSMGRVEIAEAVLNRWNVAQSAKFPKWRYTLLK